MDKTLHKDLCMNINVHKTKKLVCEWKNEIKV